MLQASLQRGIFLAVSLRCECPDGYQGQAILNLGMLHSSPSPRCSEAETRHARVSVHFKLSD